MVDNVEVLVQGGRGGAGAASFHREKYAPRGGPDGGDGGSGGDVIIEADGNVEDLGWFKARRVFRAADGERGGKNRKSGRGSEALVLRVPVGTLVWERDQVGGKRLLADLVEPHVGVRVALGGRGGRGNAHFATPHHQVPTEAEEGHEGEQRRLELELRLMADVVLVGPPSSGKSLLLGRVSRAPVTVAEYPFTTRQPVLGAVDLGMERIVLMELPGLVPGASLGRGLGNGFLRHAKRARALLFVLAGDTADPVSDYVAVRDEVSLYDEGLLHRPQMVAVNKVDLPSVQARLSQLREHFQKLGVPVCFISAQTGQGVPELLALAAAKAEEGARRSEAESSVQEEVVVFRPRPRKKG
ncbi:MAG: Obg family GTPase CgtA [Chloroflexota bacterium]